MIRGYGVRRYEGTRILSVYLFCEGYISRTPRTLVPSHPQNIDQHPTANTHFNTENAKFENFPPEVLNFAKMKRFS